MSGKIKKGKPEKLGILYSREVVVTDNWSPCFDGNKIHVGLSMHKFGKEYLALFSAYGMDDFGVCMKFRSDSYDCTYSILYNWKRFILDRIPDGIDVVWFYEHGFYRD